MALIDREGGISEGSTVAHVDARNGKTCDESKFVNLK